MVHERTCATALMTARALLAFPNVARADIAPEPTPLQHASGAGPIIVLVVVAAVVAAILIVRHRK